MSNDERPESLAAQAAAWVPPWERPQRPPDRAFQSAAEEAALAGPGDGEVGDPEAERVGEDGPTGEQTAGEQAAGELVAVDDLVDADDFAPGETAGNGPVAGGWNDAVATAEDEAVDWDEPVSAAASAVEDDEERSEAGLSDDDDDFDEAFEGGNPPGYSAPVVDDEPGEAAFGAAVEAPAMVDAPHGDDPVGGPTDVRVGPELPLPESIEQAADAPAEDEGGAPVDAPLPPDGDDAGDVFDAAADDDVSDDDEVDLPFTEEVPAADEDLTAAGEDVTDPDKDVASGAEGLTGGAAAAGGVSEAGGAQGAGLGDGPVGEPDGKRGRAKGRTAVPEQSRAPWGDLGAVVDSPRRTEEEVDLPGLAEDEELAAALEAILLVVDEPVAEMQLAQILEQPTERVANVLDDISARYTAAGHGFDLRRAAGGWRLYTRPEYAAYVERFVLDGQSVRLTQAALETLAVVAYKQPVTRSRISAIRGVNCDGVMRTLVTRGLIEECGTEGETGAYLYRTTPLFLEKLGLNSVDQLPPLAPFLPDDVEEVLDASG